MTGLLALYATFMLVSLSGALSPGPLTAVSLQRGRARGPLVGSQLAFGHGLVEFPLVLAIAFGLGQFLQRPLVNGLVALFGSAVLLWMGYGLVSGVLRRQLSLDAAATAPAPAMFEYGHVPGGVALTVTNPYWSLWWASLGATYVARTAGLGLGLLAVVGPVVHALADRLRLARRLERAHGLGPRPDRRPDLPRHPLRLRPLRDRLRVCFSPGQALQTLRRRSGKKPCLNL